MNLSNISSEFASQFEEEFNLNQPLYVEDIISESIPEKTSQKTHNHKKISEELAEVFITKEINNNTLGTEADILNFFNTQVNQQEKLNKQKNIPLSEAKKTLKALKNLKKDPTIATGDLLGIALFLQNFEVNLEKHFSKIKNKSQRIKNINELTKELDTIEETLHNITDNSDQGITIKNSINSLGYNYFEFIGATRQHKQSLENMIA